MASRELIGNAARDCDLAWVALTVSQGRIAAARGEGRGTQALCRDVAGLALLEAAAVPGEPLALDALHDALGPAVSARPSPNRVAVAMSGGVDSAVALLDAKDAGHEPVGVTRRLLDRSGRARRRACAARRPPSSPPASCATGSERRT